MKKLYIILAFLFVAQIHAQQDPQYTQYMYNMNVVNPAYAGSYDGLAVGLLYRSQWVGLEGAPKTGTLAIHSPVGKRVGLGMSLISDEVGPVRETNAYADFSYTLPVGVETKLAFGVKAGATFHDIGLNGLVLTDSDDQLFQDINEVTPNIGAGVYFYKPNKYYVSVSMPNILNATHLDAGGYNIGSETQHLFAAAGYVFDLSENFKLKPHALVKTAFDAPTSFDVNANVFMYDLVEVGVGYRLEDSFSGMVNFMVTPNLRIGYAYDAIQSDLNYTTSSSHEVFVNFDISFAKKVSRSPRYF
ncbi:type IX secretion system membrane protein PorP/SprF [Oceanihabitans sediminis]|uniref:Type IX secretion system membrane protein PorP/SprF n=1 Tax=Oceanihabitans sediminis TaxID=1812012 RepID=A0A368P6N5_9FLAO|nr:type IX secretion system membrane protein PorP/SprF [Oceanihabitans sediminis]MDX1277611.1 type IX secretion system membrane protein PorP/SprF [Oceanihabitans sediminis]MDX1773214.1 type IX secretion system membrane protein PorP/SprF [Oceanihabitans sediminis]RBP34907.1 type IX secretion system PorP/SprF family membrane protein [Oceanihabitans sediminis]RCU58547.1 type IX secretion system membrane protein PorP/SprF [Oceanihabitans sediminis]